MPTTLGKELRKIFDNKDFPENTRFFDNACYVCINDDLLLKIEFAGGTKEFKAIRLTVINKTQGCVDKTDISFRHLLGVKAVPDPYFENGIAPVLCYNGFINTLDWFIYTPNENDFSKIRNIVIQYIDVYRNFTLEKSQDAPKKSIPKKEDISL